MTHDYNPVDVHVGQRLRMRRTLRGFTQQTLAKAVGVTFQQIQKYESGKNQVSAMRMLQFSEVLDTDVNFFFDGILPHAKISPVSSYFGFAEKDAQVAFESGGTNNREVLELVRAFSRIPDASTRKRILELVRDLSDKTEKTDKPEKHAKKLSA